MRWSLRAAALLLVAGMLQASCAHSSSIREISRERAIQIARHQASFEPDRIEATRLTLESTPIWRVVLRGRLPGQPPGLFETAIVDVDRRTGEIVSVAKN